MSPLVIAVGFALAAAAGDLVGGLLATSSRIPAGRGRAQLTAIAAGIMLGTCFLSLIPEVIRATGHGPVLLASGFLMVFIAEDVFSRRAHSHDHGPAAGHPEAVTHELIGALAPDEPLITRLASWAAFVGLSIHAFFDGVAIVVSWAVSPAVGLLTFAAVILHKVPEGFSMSAIMLAAARAQRGAALAAGALAALTVGGAAAALVAESLNPDAASALLAIATGTLLYVVATDLLPVVNRTGGAVAPITVGLGVALVYATLRILGSVGLN